jgi:hypothetical protein
MNEDFWLIFGGRMYQGTKVCNVKDSHRCDLWPRPCDLETEIPIRPVSPKWDEIFGLIFGGRMYQGTKVCRMKNWYRCDLWPWPCDRETEIPFRSVFPKQMNILGWYLVGGCIGGQRCVPRKICIDVIFDLDPVTVKPKFPSALYLLNVYRFLVDIWWEDVSGYKGVLHKRLGCMRPLTLILRSLKPKSLPLHISYMNEDFWLSMQCLTFTQWPWPKIASYLPLALYPKRMKILVDIWW